MKSFLLLNLLICLSNGSKIKRAVVGRSNDGKWYVDENKWDNNNDKYAWGTFEDTLLTKGWGILDLETNNNFEDEEQAYAAGLLEGYLTAKDIRNTAINIAPEVYKGVHTMPKDVESFFDKQEKWARDMIKDNKKDDPFWRHAGYVFAQYDGLRDGFEMTGTPVPKTQTLKTMIQMLNGVGDLFDIIPAVKRHERVHIMNMTRREAELWHSRNGHCSALVKMSGNYDDIFVGHSSWFTFANTNRIYKHYSLNFNHPSTKSRKISFSSYPGFLESLDDFYTLESGITWTQTSNGMIDQTVYDAVKPQSLLAWQRVRIASAMADSGPSWYKYFRKHFSGTYANQYIIVDMNRFTPKKDLKPDTLWIIEEMPGLLIGEDKTDMLRLGYWPSYNIPYFKEIYNKAGYPSSVEKFGNFWTYDLNPRGEIFRRDNGKVKDLEGLKKILRSNEYLDDPYSKDGDTKNPLYAICSRGDLRPQPINTAFDAKNLLTSNSPTGCYDTKVTSYRYGAKSRKAQIINGPTSKYSGKDQIQPFTWDEFPNQAHYGLPQTYTFDFIPTEPKTFTFNSKQESSNLRQEEELEFLVVEA